MIQRLIPSGDWAFRRLLERPVPGRAEHEEVCLKGDFDTNHIYELLYDAKDPMVLGIGFAATRDFISFLRNSNAQSTGECRKHDEHKHHGRRGDDDDDDDGGTEGHGRRHAPCPVAGQMPDNPLGQSIQNAIIYGSSQSGRWIRTFIHLGFNEDENRNLVVEGAIPHKASNRGAFNVRWPARPPFRYAAPERQFPGASRRRPGASTTTGSRM